MAGRLTAKDEPLKDVIGKLDSFFIIPRYQRNYAWGHEQVRDFWTDLKKDSETFFAGSIVVNTESIGSTDGYAEIIDGQQRLTTCTILAAVIRDKFKLLGDEEAALDVQREFIGHRQRVTKEYKFKLLASESLRPFLQKYVQKYDSSGFPESLKPGQQKLVMENFSYFSKELDSELDSYTEAGEKIRRLNEIYEALREMVVIYITVNNSDEAYDIFETMNARGADLTVADLVKNHLFKEVKRSPTGEDFAKDTWGEIIDNLEGSGLDFTTFLRYHWLSRYGFLMKKKLFKAIKTNISDYRRFLKDLKKDSEVIKAFGSCHIDDLGIFDHHRKNKSVNSSLRTINAIGARGCYVLLLSIVRNIEDLRMINAHRQFRFIESFIFYYHGVSGLPANRFERTWSEESVKLNKIKEKPEKYLEGNVDRWVTQLEDTLRKEKDEMRFRDSFKEKMVYKNNTKSRDMIRHFFELYNKHLGDKEGYDVLKIDIEHILPQNPKKWGLTKKEVRSYVNSIGNLTLIGEEINKEMANEILENKLPLLEKSKIFMNRELVKICNQKDPCIWDEHTINQRSDKLLEVALEICDY